MDVNIEDLADAIAKRLGIRNNQETVTPITFDELAALYIQNHAKPRKKTWHEDEKRNERYLLPTFSGKLLTDIKRTEVIAMHAVIGATKPYAANRALEQLVTMFKKAQLWGFYPEDKMPPTAGVETLPERSRDVFVQKNEMTKLSEAISQCRAKHYQVLFWLYLLTALRRCELLHAKWTDLDVDRWELRVLKNKSDRPHYVPLTAEAMALLDTLPHRSVYIFPGGKPGQPLSTSTVWRAWDRTRRRAGMGHIRIHDLRRTVASWMAQSGQPLSLIGKLLNHSSARATEIYARFAQDDVRAALQRHTSELTPHM